MNFIDLLAGENDDNRRLDRVLAHILPPDHDSIPKLLRKNLIRLNDKKADCSAHISKGDKISIAEFLLNNQNNTQIQDNTSDLQIETIFENQYIKIINKPYGINVQPSQDSKIDLSSVIQKQYKNSCDSNKSLSFVPGALHRLDKNTTGVLAFSQNLQGAQWFSQNMADHIIKKTYVAIIEGHLQKSELWEDYLCDDTPQANFHTVKVTKNKEEGSIAITKATPLAYGEYKTKAITLAQFDIKTGRKHQIRCQSSFHGHALLGDTAYKAERLTNNKAFFLHAISLRFPKNNPLELPEEIRANLPLDFVNFLNTSLIKWDGKLII